MSAIRILLVDDQPVVLQGVRLMLAKMTDVTIAGEARDSVEALRLARSQPFDVVITDINLPGRSGLELTQMLHAEFPRLPVLVFSIYTEDLYAVRALKLGASGYVTKDVEADVLAGAIRKVVQGGKYLTPRVAERLATAIQSRADQLPHDRLSEREFQVFRLIATGKGVTEVAETMNVSRKTVTTYRARILEKMSLSTNADLTRYGLEHGLLD
jgi:two-component system, NarL family, invasion response regulator UvrY